MWTWGKLPGIRVVLATVGALGLAGGVGYLLHASSDSIPDCSVALAPIVDRTVGRPEANSTPADGLSPLGSVLGCNNPAPPPVTISVGLSPETAGPDRSTPGMAVYSVLELIDERAIEELAPCFAQRPNDPAGGLYPRYLGRPVGLIDVVVEGESAKVAWEATVHTAFSRRGKRWSPGETITVTTRLVRVDGLWRIATLCEGGDDAD